MKRRFAVGTVLTVALVGAAALLLSGVASGKSSVTPLPSSSCGQSSTRAAGHRTPDRDRSAAAGRRSCAADRDGEGSPIRLSAASTSSRPASTRSATRGATTRRPRPVRGTRRSAPSNARALRGRQERWSAVLGTFNSGCAKLERADPQPGAGWSRRDAQLGEHGRRADALRFVERPGRAGDLLPDRACATTPACRPRTTTRARLPRDLLKQLATGQERVRDPRQPDVRQGRRQRVPVSGPQKLGIKVLGFEPWDPKATSYEAIGQQIKDSGAQSVYLGGIVCNNGVKLLKDLRAGRRPEAASSSAPTAGRRTPPRSALARRRRACTSATRACRSRSSARRARRSSPASGKYANIKGQLPPYSVYQAQAAQIILDAIARSNGTRKSVTTQLFKTNVKNGIMGTFHFDKNGDTSRSRRSASTRSAGRTGEVRVRRHLEGHVGTSGVRSSRERSSDERGRAFGPFPVH